MARVQEADQKTKVPKEVLRNIEGRASSSPVSIMKHVSAYLGLSKETQILKRAWWPKLSTSGEWIRPFEQYYVVTRTWAPALSTNGEIKNTRILTKYEFILEKLSIKNT